MSGGKVRMLQIVIQKVMLPCMGRIYSPTVEQEEHIEMFLYFISILRSLRQLGTYQKQVKRCRSRIMSQ